MCEPARHILARRVALITTRLSDCHHHSTPEMRLPLSCSRPLLRTANARLAPSSSRAAPRCAQIFRRRLTSNSDDLDASEHDLRFGCYDVILPPEPYEWGTAHIIPRGVPPQIPKPPYVQLLEPGADASTAEEDVATTKRKFITDAEELIKLRRAARLASDVLTFAGSLVQVSTLQRA